MLEQALASLARLETNNAFRYQVLVVDNASTDQTPNVITRAAEKWPALVRGVREKTPGVVAARNRGVAEARSQWIAFFDDDQLADPHWLAELFNAARRKNMLCVGGAVRLLFTDGMPRTLPDVTRMLLGETIGQENSRLYNHRFTPGTGNLMLHRSIFETIGGFDQRFHARNEDTDLFLRMHRRGIAAWYEPAAVVDHLTPPERLTARYLLKIANLISVGMAANEQASVGAAYPLVAAARCVQFALLLTPRYAWHWARRNKDQTLAARCRWEIARRYLCDASRLLFSAPKAVQSPPGPDISPSPRPAMQAGQSCEFSK